TSVGNRSRGKNLRANPERQTSPLDDRDAHAAGGALDDPRGVVDVAGVQVVDLLAGDLGDLLLGQAEPLVLAALLVVGGGYLPALLLAGRDLGGQLDEHRRPRALALELQAAVRIDGDDPR